MEPGRQTYFGAFQAQICILLIAQLRVILCAYCPLQERFPDIFVIHVPAEKKD